MSACETCWTEASRRALTAGGHTADHYRDLLAEHPEGHAQRDDEWVLCENCGVRDCYHQASVLMSTPPTALGRDQEDSLRTEYAVSCGGEVHEHHFGGTTATTDYRAAFDLLASVAQRCKKGHHRVVSREIKVGPWV